MPGKGIVLNLTGRTRVAAVIGDPVAHSLSPAIHNAAFAATGLDWAYVALPVPEGDGGDAVNAMRVLGLAGLSVTMPHKEAVLAGVDRVEPASAALGAANCIAWAGKDLVAHNTDGDGFVESLRHDNGLDPAGLDVAVLGAGGASRSVIRALAANGARSLVIVNRSADRAAAAAAVAPGVTRVGAVDEIAGVDLVVNATSVGMGRPADDPGALPCPREVLGAGQTVVDLVYTPTTTALLAAAAAVGAKAVDGIGMLTHQAALAFTLWTGEVAPVEVMANAARRAIEAR
jgi:shikimate dehydrogenase